MTQFLLTCLLLSQLKAPAPVEAPAGGHATKTSLSTLKPVWTIGDRWRIETTTPSIGGGANASATVRWEFHVEGMEVVDRRDCFRVRVRCLTPADRQPVVMFWTDRNSLALVHVSAQVPGSDRPFTLSESYQFLGEQPTPVIGPFPALPLDLPSFLETRSKSVDDFYYEALPGPVGAKAAGDVGFLYRVTQSVRLGSQLSRDAAQFAKSGNDQPLAEVRLQAAAVSVRQFWRSGAPWPVFSTNGQTVSRLLPTEEPLDPERGD